MSKEKQNQVYKKTEESSGYYAKRPSFGQNGPSKLRQKFSRGMTIFCSDRCLYPLLFCAVKAARDFRSPKRNIQGLKTNCLWTCNCISSESDR